MTKEEVIKIFSEIKEITDIGDDTYRFKNGAIALYKNALFITTKGVGFRAKYEDILTINVHKDEICSSYIFVDLENGIFFNFDL